MRGGAVKLEDLEKHIFLVSDGEHVTTTGEFLEMKKVCEENGSRIVTVIDAESELVCFAPFEIAVEIAKLLDNNL